MMDRRLPFRDIALGCQGQDDIALAQMLADHAERPTASWPGGEPDAGPSLSQPFAKGTYVARTHRSDLQSFRGSYEVREHFAAAMEAPPHLHVGMYFEGGGRYRVGRATHRPPRAVPMMAWFGHTTEVVTHHRAGERVVMAGLNIGEAFFEAAAEGLWVSASDDVRRCLGAAFAHRDLPEPAALGSILREIHACPYHGFLEALHLESLCLSAIVALTVHLQGGAPRPAGPLGRRNLAQEARELLDTEPESASSTSVLAKRLATNETSLRRSFKTAFGTTIADYVRDRRLDAARAFVRDTGLQIAEIAYRAGYTDPANFTTAYRRRFGRPPSRDRPLVRP